MTRPRVVVVGAGFGGLWAARDLVDRPADVVLVDRNNFHTFFPLLYQVAAAELSPNDIAYPVRSILRGASNVAVRMAEVVAVDLDARTLETSAGPLPYDYLVLALGSVPDYFGVPGAEEHALPLRWMDDAVPLRHRILHRFEEAAALSDPTERRAKLTFVIVGGGATGVEFAGALAELIHGPLLRDYPTIDGDEVSVLLLEAGERLLASMPERLGRYASDRLGRRRVAVRLRTAVRSVHADGVTLSSGERIPAHTVTWTAGVKGDPLVAGWGLPVGPRGRVEVTEFLNLASRSEVFVVGDLAYREDEDGAPLPQVAPVAVQQARCAADNILRAIRGEAPRPFRFKDPGMLAVIGRNAAVATVAGRAFRGFTAWVLWLVIHVAKLIGFRNRALVLVNWAWNYVFYRRAVRLLLSAVDRAGPTE